MALDNPALPFAPQRWLRSARLVELSVVVSLTLAVVAVAVWFGSPTAPEDELAAALEPLPAAAVDAPLAAAAPLPAAESAPAAAETSRGALAPVPAILDLPPAPPIIPAQSGIVPGQPDPLEPEVPDSLEHYQVQRGESLHSIAAARGVTVAELVSWNWRLREDSELIRGEWIWIPQWPLPIVADEAGAPADEGKRGRGGG